MEEEKNVNLRENRVRKANTRKDVKKSIVKIPKKLYTIIAAICVIVILFFGIKHGVMLFSNNPKSVVQRYISETLKEPYSIKEKYSLKEFDKKLLKETARKLKFKIIEVGKIEKNNDGVEKVEIVVETSNTNMNIVKSKAEKNLKDKKINITDKNYYEKLINEIKRLNNKATTVSKKTKIKLEKDKQNKKWRVVDFGTLNVV